MQRIRKLAAKTQLPLEGARPAEPELEDVFVAVLEESQQERAGGQGG